MIFRKKLDSNTSHTFTMPIEKTFYYSGKLLFEGRYNEAGEKHEKCICYLENGQTLYEEHYNNGLLINKKYFTEENESKNIVKLHPDREKEIIELFKD